VILQSAVDWNMIPMSWRKRGPKRFATVANGGRWWLLNALQHFYRGGFARAVGAEQAKSSSRPESPGQRHPRL
jgi:hypothetical protein